MKYLLLYLFLFISTFSFSQDETPPPCPCCTEDHKAFDFWEGDWVVFDTAGTQVGENLIVKLQNNCILQENWKGGSGLTGSSYNYFNRTDSTWNQVWIDANGGNLVLKGKSELNKMTLRSELLKGQRVPLYRNQVTWTKNEDGSVLQLWLILDENEKVLQEAFRGIYRKKT